MVWHVERKVPHLQVYTLRNTQPRECLRYSCVCSLMSLINDGHQMLVGRGRKTKKKPRKIFMAEFGHPPKMYHILAGKKKAIEAATFPPSPTQTDSRTLHFISPTIIPPNKKARQGKAERVATMGFHFYLGTVTGCEVIKSRSEGRTSVSS